MTHDRHYSKVQGHLIFRNSTAKLAFGSWMLGTKQIACHYTMSICFFNRSIPGNDTALAYLVTLTIDLHLYARQLGF